MTSFMKRIIQISIALSLYNMLAWIFDWGRFGFNYFGPAFWAIIPQIGLTVWLALLLKNYERYIYRMLAPVIGFALWIATLLITNIEYLTMNETIPWPLTYSLLDAIGFPILEMEIGGAAPLFGLFHSNEGDLNIVSDWYFDGGIVFSWLVFNVLTLPLLVTMTRIAIQDRHDLNLRWRS